MITYLSKICIENEEYDCVSKVFACMQKDLSSIPKTHIKKKNRHSHVSL